MVLLLTAMRQAKKNPPEKEDLYTVKNGVVLIAFCFFPGFIGFSSQHLTGDE